MFVPGGSGADGSGADGPIRFSVVVPAFNEACYIGDTLRSLRQQDVSASYEVIVVDNNSSDATADIATSLGATVLHEREPGVCAARQRGTLQARGEVVVSTDADTVHPRDWLSRIDAGFRSESVVAVAGPCRYQNPSWWAVLYPKLLFGAVGRLHALTGRVFYLSATNLAFSRAAFPGYNTKLTQGGDELDLLRRLRRRGRIGWLADNVVDTSPRRLEQGLVYTLLVSLLAHYLLAYAVNRLASRTLLGMAPAFRRTRRTRLRRRSTGWRLMVPVALLVGTSATLARFAVPVAVGHIARFMTLRH